MTSWGDIPFDKNASPEEKALEFDLQFEESRIGAQQHKPNFTEEHPEVKGKNIRK